MGIRTITDLNCKDLELSKKLYTFITVNYERGIRLVV